MKIEKTLITGSLSLLILHLLAEQDMYGYEMIATLESRSDKTFSLKAGTLYPLLHGLEQKNAVVGYEKAAATGRMRKYYSITPAGKGMLQEKKQEWDCFSSSVNKVLDGGSLCAAN